MTETRKVTGLLGAVAAEAEGAEWEVSTALQNGVVPGMGLGASPDAIRWARLGYTLEVEEILQKMGKVRKQKKGRPKKSEVLNKGNVRAFHMWLELRCMPLSFRSSETNRSLIAWIISRQDLPKSAQKLWPPGNTALEKSLSAGRQYWDINDAWESEKCAKFWAELAPK